MVAGNPKDLYSRISELGKRGKRSEAASGNHRLPLEPEIEKIPVDHQRRRFAGESTQKRNEGAFDLGAGDS